MFSFPTAAQRHAVKPILNLFIIATKTAFVAHAFVSYGFYHTSAIGPSMLPTLQMYGDQLWIDRRYRYGRDIKVGDMVACMRPDQPDSPIAKRIVGMPGDYVLKGTPESGSTEMIQVRLASPWRRCGPGVLIICDSYLRVTAGCVATT